MSVKKKGLIAVVAVLIMLCVGSFALNREGTKGSKEIAIKIVDETTSTTVYDDVVYSDALTLEELLKEQTQWKAVIESSTYGALLNAIMDLEQDMNKGPWLLFASDNNAVCVEQGMCPALDKVVLSNKDAFVFTYTSDLDF